MKKILAIFLLVPIFIYSQSVSIDFHSPENIKKFGNCLFCEGDYLRAVEEYEAIRDVIRNDTIDFKIMICYSEIGLYELSNNSLERIRGNSPYRWDGSHLSLKNKLLSTQKGLRVVHDIPLPPDVNNRRKKLINVSYFFDEQFSFAKDDFLTPFDNIERQTVSLFYDLKINAPYKSPTLAGVFSAVIPGSGKMYVGEWGDGITALLVTGLFAFLAYDNFRAGHNTRAWIFTGLGAFFYTGNIYGSVAAAQIFNARIDFEFKDGLNVFLQQKNYFLPEYDFCK
jgi:TM2 domain-containing membrane protein YozV